MNDLTKGNISKGLILFTLPLLLGNFFQILYHTTDTIIVGQTLGKLALASVGATGAVNFLIVGFAQGLTSGLTIVTAQRFGAKHFQDVKKSFATGLVFTVVASLILSVLSVIFIGPLLKLMQTPDEIFEGAKTFMTFMLGGMIFANLFNFLSNALRALGDSKTPLYALVISSIANIILEYTAILGLGWGIAGASIATVTAQAISVCYLVYHISKKVPELYFPTEYLKFDKNEFKEHARLSLPMGFQSSIIAIGSITLQIALNTLGTNAVATQSIVSKVDQFAMLPMISIGLAMSTFAAQNYGAQKYKRIISGLKQATLISVIWGIIYAILLITFNHQITTVFISSSETAVINMAKQYYIINGAFYWLLAILFSTRGTIQGLGNSKIPTLAGFMELFMRAGVAIYGVHKMSYTIVVASNPAAWIGSILVLIPTILVTVRSFKKLS
ncbi:MATE family efflux transporter [Floricoccus penangensis]|uniref:Probable multidrug resistance protein NorM n=1 Tax=Floricoccus penangensis TaxID=1859475 RepID=A0A9Q5P038_9LACT|nr:MATE family efflux transporter [Floricoccus penangensis]OFI47239.1 MATE family efflux transporter [Floricoccus penangensis]